MKLPLVISMSAVCLAATAQGQLFSDNFNRTNLPPWVAQSGSWAVTNGALQGGLNPAFSYGLTYITNTFTNFSAEARIQFPGGGYGGGLGGRLNLATGTRYAAWVYPENAAGDSNVLKLIKFSDYSMFTLLQQANLPGVGTNFHTVKLEFASANQINVYFDSNKVVSATDATPYTNGAVSLEFWTGETGYRFTADDVVVSSLPIGASNDTYTAISGLTLRRSAPGVLSNDTGGIGPLTARLASSPTHGTFTLTNNGGFAYTATNGYTGVDSFTYRATDGVTTSSVATVSITVTADQAPVANNDTYTILQNSTLTVAMPGVLGNDTDADGNSLTAALVSGPANGVLTLTNNGGFTYIPTTGFAGTDSFTYRANDGLSNSAPATVTINVLSIVPLYSDTFGRTNLSPWVAQSGVWAVTNGALRGGTNTLASYGVAYLTNTWTNYSVQATIQFPAGAFGGGIDACLNPATGARYSAWIYPEGSSGGANTLKLIKFQDWTTFGYNGTPSVPIQSVNLASVGTIPHTLKLACAGNRIAVFLDGILMISVTDVEAQPYLSGAIGADFWTATSGYQMAVDDVLVTSLVNDDSYSAGQNTVLSVNAPGVLGNDTALSGSGLTAVLLSGPAHGILTLTNSGGFSYIATNGYTGTDSFNYQALDGSTTLGTATATIEVGAGGSGNVFFFENFDGVTPPALPSGWTTSAGGTQSPWYTTNSPRDTVPNSAFCPDADTTNITELVSPAFFVPTGPPQLVFSELLQLGARQRCQPGEGYDGGVLEIKIGAGAFTDILAAGGSFAANGYNRTLSTLWQNPLGGRQAWSGRSTSFSNVVVNLPAAAVAQNIQLRWRCATDADNANGGGTGWRIDTVAVKVNGAPMLTNLADRTIVELATLTVTNTATDPDVPANTLTYSLLAAPGTATISASGVITWTPTEAQGPGTNTFTTRVVDNGVPPLSATNTFKVVVNESNSPPLLPPQASRTIAPLITLLVTNTATDPDLPANTLTYTLLVAPTNAVINTNTGVINWTPSQAQVGTTNLFTTVVTDYNPSAVNAQSLSATNSFTVFVGSTPVIVLDSTALVGEGFLPTNNAIDPGETVTRAFLPEEHRSGKYNQSCGDIAADQRRYVAFCASNFRRVDGWWLGGGPVICIHRVGRLRGNH